MVLNLIQFSSLVLSLIKILLLILIPYQIIPIIPILFFLIRSDPNIDSAADFFISSLIPIL